MKNRLHLLALLVILFIACDSETETTSSEEQTETRPPNIIYILADDLGYGDLGCYGQEHIQTPNLDLMAAEGMRFTSHYSGSTVCAPSRAVLMTGIHTGHLRSNSQGQTLAPDDIIIPKLLKQKGYRTALIGKWGLGEDGTTGEPNKQGFDYFFGYLNQIRAHNYWTDWLWRNQDTVRLDNEVVIVDEGYAKGVGSYATKKEEYSHDLFTEEALQFIDESQDTSFFLYLAYTIPHANNEGGQQGMEVPSDAPYTDTDFPQQQKNMAAMVTRMDGDIGKILTALENAGIAENTLVIFTSDNGPHKEGGNDPDFFNSNGPLRGIKRDLYEGGIRMPCIAWWPETIAPGSETDHISGFQDVLPTMMDVATIEKPDSIDGISFLPTLLGNSDEQQQHDYLYWEFPEQGGKVALRQNNWKLVINQDNPPELYDLSEDIGETNNLASDMPEKVVELQQLMDEASEGTLQ